MAKVDWRIVLPVLVVAVGCAGSSLDHQYSLAVERMVKLSAGVQLYAGDNDDTFMQSDWMDAITPYVDSTTAFVSPVYDNHPGLYGIAFNQDLVGKTRNSVGDLATTLALFDSTNLAYNAVASIATLPSPPRYREGNVRAYADGTVPDAPIPPGPTDLEISVKRLKQVSLANMMYSNDYDDNVCLSDWNDALLPYTKTASVFKSPLYDGTDNYGYAMNQDIVGINVTSVGNPADVISFFDSTLLQRQAVSSTSTIPEPGRYDGQNAVGFLDGHVMALPILDPRLRKKHP